MYCAAGLCTLEMVMSYGQRIIPYRPTFTLPQTANLAKTISGMPPFGVIS